MLATATGIVFEDLRAGHVDAYRGWLCLLATFLTGRPASAAGAVLHLRGPPRVARGTAVGCVCRAWRAAEARGLAMGGLPPGLSLAPDGRAGYSAPAGHACGWYWLEALTWDYFVAAPLVYRETLGDASDGWSTDDGWRVGQLIRQDRFPRFWRERQRAQSLEAARIVRRIRRYRMEMPWGLDVGTAVEIAHNLLPGGLQVTVWWDGLYRASRRTGAVELMLDLTRYHWMVVRSVGFCRFDSMQLAPRHWMSAYGMRDDGAPSSPRR